MRAAARATSATGSGRRAAHSRCRRHRRIRASASSSSDSRVRVVVVGVARPRRRRRIRASASSSSEVRVRVVVVGVARPRRRRHSHASASSSSSSRGADRRLAERPWWSARNGGAGEQGRPRAPSIARARADIVSVDSDEKLSFWYTAISLRRSIAPRLLTSCIVMRGLVLSLGHSSPRVPAADLRARQPRRRAAVVGAPPSSVRSSRSRAIPRAPTTR